jgi:DNA polymerase III gamma/tau subunit
MLIGQPRVEAILNRALQRDRVSHAYLFLGPEGSGKATAASRATTAAATKAMWARPPD